MCVAVILVIAAVTTVHASNPLIVGDYYDKPDFGYCAQHVASGESSVVRRCISTIGVNGIFAILPASCHSQGHPVGRLATEVTQDTAQLMEAVQYHCHGAGFHGVIEGLLLRMWEETGTEVPVDFSEPLDDDTAARLFETIEEVCNHPAIGMYMPSPYGECLHATGHALSMTASASNTMAEIERNGCFRLVEDVSDHEEHWKVNHCTSGLSMQMYEHHRGSCDDVAFTAACMVYQCRIRSCKRDFCLPVDDLCYRRGSIYGCTAAISMSYNAHSVRDMSNLLRQCLAWFEDKDDRLACVDGLMQRSGKYFPEAAEQVCASIRSQPDPDFYEMCMLSFHNGIYGDLKSYDPYLCLAAGR